MLWWLEVAIVCAVLVGAVKLIALVYLKTGSALVASLLVMGYVYCIIEFGNRWDVGLIERWFEPGSCT